MKHKKPKRKVWIFNEETKQCCHDGSKGFYGLYPLSARCLNKCDFKQFDGWILLDTAALERFTILDTREFLDLLICPVPDHKPPTPKQMERILQFIQEHEKTLISCIGAHGRTGTVLAIWLYLHEPEGDPILRVRERYCKEAVESKEQALFIYDFLKLEPNHKLLSELDLIEPWIKTKWW